VPFSSTFLLGVIGVVTPAAISALAALGPVAELPASARDVVLKHGRPDVSAPIIVDAATSACWTADCPGESVRHPAALAVVKASRCEATNSRTVIGGLPVSSAMNLSSPEKRPF
jgi:hypothetical protein